ncbi:hypothetical protein ACFY8O_19265 [Streptomyces argenteolus]|uniref:Uncharacterized protein n=1 Tax=Streptomyces argenteolus TaxID=67274 RepID=A0ABW6X7L8_9ACTN
MGVRTDGQGRNYLTGRLHEWTLLRSIAMDEPWTADELTAASDGP